MAALKGYMILLILGISPYQFLFFENNLPVAVPGEYFNYQLTNATKISISGSSNVNEFTCLAYQDFMPASGIMQVNESSHHITFQHTSINIPVKSLSCDNEVMDYDMYDALKCDKYPYITLAVKEVYTTNKQKIDLSKSTPLIIIADLRIAGITKSQQIKITASATTDGQFVFRGSHFIKLSEFNIDAPTALFGVIKVKDEVKINFDLHVKLN